MNRDMPTCSRCSTASSPTRSSTSPPRARSRRAGITPNTGSRRTRVALAQLVNHLRKQKYLEALPPRLVAGGLRHLRRPRHRGLAAQPEHALRREQGRGRLSAEDLREAVRLPAAHRAGDQRLRRPAAAVQDHSAVGHLHEARQDDRAARRRPGGEIVHPHSRRVARREARSSSAAASARSITSRPIAASRCARSCGLICDRCGKRSKTRPASSTSGRDRTRPTSSTRPRPAPNSAGGPRSHSKHGLAEVVDWVNAYWPEIQRQPLEYRHAA